MKTDHLISAIASVIIAVAGLAVVAALVSKQSNTANVATSGGKALSQIFCAALAPVTGQKCSTSVSSTITYGGPVTQYCGPNSPIGPCPTDITYY